MDRLIFTSHSAIAEAAIARQALVNEMSNVSTAGFKRSFDVTLRTLKVQGDGFDSRFQSQAVSRDVIDLEPGPIIATNRPMDVSFGGATVMGVQSRDGQLAFTRRGDLHLNAQGVLETGQGHMVRGVAGPIVVPPGFLVQVNRDGTVMARDPAQPAAPGVQVGQLLLRDASQQPLVRRTDGLFGPQGLPPGSDFPNGPQPNVLTSNSLEGSNVNAIYGMTRMIDQARSFEAQIRAIKEARTLDESSATLMKSA
jgi:flagellar basal-body rod protein FlgF